MKTQKLKTSRNIELGRWGEKVALDYLISKAFLLIEKNYRTPDGEIDLVMQSEGKLIFFEVKTRRGTALGYPEEAVTDEKIEHLAAAAEWFLTDHPEFLNDWRLDVISVIGSLNSISPEIVWFENVG